MEKISLVSLKVRAGRVNIAASLGEKPKMYENALELKFAGNEQTIDLVSFGSEMKRHDECQVLGSQRTQTLLVSDFPPELSERITSVCGRSTDVSSIEIRAEALRKIAEDVAAWRDGYR